MAGVRFPEVKEGGRRFFGPEDMEGIGHPPSVARAAASLSARRGVQRPRMGLMLCGSRAARWSN